MVKRPPVELLAKEAKRVTRQTKPSYSSPGETTSEDSKPMVAPVSLDQAKTTPKYPRGKSERNGYCVGKLKVTPFYFRVFDALLKVPRGKVTTYGRLAKQIGSAPRAVGQALRRNPFAPEVPCHRVITSDFRLGGFLGQWGSGEHVLEKERLLKEEGVVFVNGVLSDEMIAKCVWPP